MIHVEEKQKDFLIIVLFVTAGSNSEETKFLKERIKKLK